MLLVRYFDGDFLYHVKERAVEPYFMLSAMLQGGRLRYDDSLRLVDETYGRKRRIESWHGKARQPISILFSFRHHAPRCARNAAVIAGSSRR